MGDIQNQFREIRSVLSTVQAWKKYRTDKAQFGVPDYWRIPMIDDDIDLGDCEDWAMRFAFELLKLDWKPEDVSIALCGLRSGQGHMVCLAKTTNGHFVLDCSQRAPLPPRHRLLNIKTWYSATPLYSLEWRAITAQGGPLPALIKDGQPNSEFMLKGTIHKTHPQHADWLQRHNERNAQ